jgi:hypothetical protein
MLRVAQNPFKIAWNPVQVAHTLFWNADILFRNADILFRNADIPKRIGRTLFRNVFNLKRILRRSRLNAGRPAKIDHILMIIYEKTN